jgi:ParB-like chromosome segregation protein Spo0J
VLGAADDDPVAGAIVDRLAGEVVAMARVAMRRLGRSDCEVVLGGGVLRAGHRRLHAAIDAGLPGARVVIASEAPVVGAALMALDMIGPDDGVEERLRRELDNHVRDNGHG